MDRERLRALLAGVAAGTTSIDAALERMATLPFEDLGFANVDHHRGIRDALPEVVLAQGKTPAQVAAIARSIAERSGRFLVTRLDGAQAEALAGAVSDIRYAPEIRLAWYDPEPRPRTGNVTVVTAGTSDIPVAEEAAITAELMGAEVYRFFDIGVAGIHRLADKLPALRRANALVVVAGMEGALPSVVAGLVDVPVIAVPTSVGYGASFGGLAALLAMLNSCATGLAVVNIDNGFGAGYLAATINRMVTATARSAVEG